MVSDLLARLADSPFATAIREGELWFPWLETAHVGAVCVVFGAIVVVDLSLIGLRSYRASTARVMRDLLPWTWGAFAVAVLTGGVMFAAQAPTYAANSVFRLKLAALLAAGINMAVFHLGPCRTIDRWDGVRPVPRAVTLAGALSLALWVMVLCCGRWIGFTLTRF